ncbi:hypothetical protein [Paenibacillus marinisediminis]
MNAQAKNTFTVSNNDKQHMELKPSISWNVRWVEAVKATACVLFLGTSIDEQQRTVMKSA